MSSQRKHEEKKHNRENRKRRDTLDAQKKAGRPQLLEATPAESRGIPIPVICDDPNCGSAFTVTNAIGLADGASANLQNCSFGPCPVCGGVGHVPNGEYRRMGTDILFTPISAEDHAMLQSALKLIQRGITAEVSPADLRETGEQQIPELAELWNMVPTQQHDATQFLALARYLIMVLLLAYQATSTDRPSQLDVPADILRAIETARKNALDHRISRRDGVCGGEARIKGTRLSVWGLEEVRRRGIPDDTILEMYPAITGADLSAAWNYVASNQAEIEQLIASNNE